MPPPHTLPISVKGIVFDEGKVWLRKNERKEWELPGGKMDVGEQPEETVARELEEELGFQVEVERIIQAHLYEVKGSADESRGVLVVAYLCKLIAKPGDHELEGEAGPAEFKAFTIKEIPGLNMPQFYKDAIREARQ